jgi:wyosine [tRNA(Phe)-imidazoG37] synthetase (radical SAM superfamily)
MDDLTVEQATAARSSEGHSSVDRAPYPERIYLDWTDYCNASCFFCPRSFTEYEKQIGGKGEFVPFAKLKKLEKVLSSVKYFGISSSIGEPLLHPELQQILRWLYEINPKVSIRATTNGTALTAEKAAWFAGHLDWLSVSLNAGNGEAHMRDMFPQLANRGIDASKRWELHLRHLSEFIAALPATDRPRVRLNMIAHRHNIKDIVDFVRVVERVGCSHATISNIVVHPHIVDWSLYGVRDLYNEAVDKAFDLGARFGIRVDAPRFFTGIKPVIVDLEKACREPIDVAYINRANFSAPCCQWTEGVIPQDVYSDDEGFDRYWNQDVFRGLRQKRDSQSCRVCNLTRVFDEISFHFSAYLKQRLIASGELSDKHSKSDYPEEQLVRTCVENRLDLPSIRHTLLRLNVPVEMVEQIESLGVAALPALEQACWDAFETIDVPAGASDIYLAGPFLGIGWGPPIHDPLHKMSARWIGGAQAASIFVRVEPGLDCIMCFTIAYPSELERRLQVQVCGRQIEPRFSRDEAGRTLLIAFVPDDLTRAHDGRLWVRLACLDDGGRPAAGSLSLARVSLSQESKIVLPLQRLLAEKDALLEQQALRVSQLEQLFAQTATSVEQQLVRASQLERLLTEKNALLEQEVPRVSEMKQRLAEEDALRAETDIMLAEKDALLEQQVLRVNQLQQSLAELERTLQATYDSRSWKVTAPLRNIMTWLRR